MPLKRHKSKSFRENSHFPLFDKDFYDLSSKSSKCRNAELNIPYIIETEFKPKSIPDLAVHVKKVEELENWIKHNVQGKPRLTPILVLEGPSGCGKTAALTTVCSNYNITISEWINSVNQTDFSSGEAFQDFLKTCNGYSTIRETTNGKRCKITLVKDFPNFAYRNPNEFHSILQDYYVNCRTAIVFICSDSGENNTDMSYLLFPQKLLETMKFDKISFNPVNATNMNALLSNMNSRLRMKFGSSYQSASELVLQSIVNTSQGNIKSAINSFITLCVKDVGSLEIFDKTDETISHGTKRKRRLNTNVFLANMMKSESLGLLHGVGRVLYPKRKPLSSDRWKFEHEPSEIVDSFSTLPIKFVSFLHENYPKYFSSMESASDGAECLSLADSFLGDWSNRDSSYLYGLWVAVQGLMVANEKSVPRWNPVAGPKVYGKKSSDRFSDKYFVDIISRASQNGTGVAAALSVDDESDYEIEW